MSSEARLFALIQLFTAFWRKYIEDRYIVFILNEGWRVRNLNWMIIGTSCLRNLLFLYWELFYIDISSVYLIYCRQWCWHSVVFLASEGGHWDWRNYWRFVSSFFLYKKIEVSSFFPALSCFFNQQYVLILELFNENVVLSVNCS
jgi:hypothetical protein